MNIYKNNLWITDIDEIISNLPELKELTGKTVLITGSTGLICSAFTDILIRWNMTYHEKIMVSAAGRNEKRALERFSPFAKEDWFSFVPYDAKLTGNNFNFTCDYVIHGASNASPNKISVEPVETMLSNFIGAKCLLDYAKDKNVKRLLYISSSEVYGKKIGNHPYHISEYGGIDLLNPRNSYSVAKCAAETLCASYFEEYGTDSVIIRPGHIYGPTAAQTDSRVSSAWAYDVASGRDIVMKSDGMQLRSYCYCLDCASAILKVLLKGKSLHAYNVSVPDSIISIRKMAEILARLADVNLRADIPSEEEKKSFNPMSNSSLDATELLNLGWNGLFDIERGLSHTIKILKDCIDER